MQLTFEQAAAYFAKRLNLTKGITRDSIMARCPFHGDGTESLSVKITAGVWKCHAGCGEGGLYDFEKMMFPTYDNDRLWEGIERDAGIKREKRAPRGEDRGQLIATYDFHDADGKMVFQKLRYENKHFVQRAPQGQKWAYTLDGVTKVLYHLPEVVRASVVFISEGEKDADNVRSIDFSSRPEWNKPHFVFSSTCNFDGALKWKDDYSPYLAGKSAILFEDNDDNGRAHVQQVARSIAKYATRIKIVSFPELAVKGDVSDFLEQFGEEALLERIKAAPRWTMPKEPIEDEQPFFVPPSLLKEQIEDEDMWLVPGVINKGGKGMIVADPKAGKSMAALDLLVALASQQRWFGFKACPKKIKSGYVSREDGAEMAKKRLRSFALGRGIPLSLLEDHLRFNTYDQRAAFSLQNEDHVRDIIKWIKIEGIEFCVFDVLNYLHTANENSNTEMGAVMKQFDVIRLETGCQVTVIHHTKSTTDPGDKKPRGAGAINSWWDWKVSLAPTPEDENVKDVKFQTKAGRSHPPMQVVFAESDGATMILPAAFQR